MTGGLTRERGVYSLQFTVNGFKTRTTPKIQREPWSRATTVDCKLSTPNYLSPINQGCPTTITVGLRFPEPERPLNLIRFAPA
jgi:hypothetical protein